MRPVTKDDVEDPRYPLADADAFASGALICTRTDTHDTSRCSSYDDGERMSFGIVVSEGDVTGKETSAPSLVPASHLLLRVAADHG